jgi:hypothetical protein
MIINIRGKKPSTNTVRQRKIIKENDKCYICNNIFRKNNLEIEHKIPLCIGGDIENIGISCIECHKYKTKRDLLYIYFLKKIGWLIKIGQYKYEIYNKLKILEGYELFGTGKSTRTGNVS